MLQPTHRRPGPSTHLHAPQPQRILPPLRVPSPSSTWSRYPAMHDVSYLISPKTSVAPSPEPSPGPWQPGVPLRPVSRQGLMSDARLEAQAAEAMDEPHSVCHRVFVWTLRIVFGGMALSVPALLIWYGLRPRNTDT